MHHIGPGRSLVYRMSFATPDSAGNPPSGTIHISVDESFKPVIDSQLKVFESSFPDAHVLVDYKAEAACLRDLSNDSVRMVIVTRGLSLAEERYFRDTAKTPAISGILAYDAVALVVNNHSQDTVMTMDEVRDLLEGNDKKKREAVMDGVSATSTVDTYGFYFERQSAGKKRCSCQVKPTGDFLCSGSRRSGRFCGIELDR